MQRVYLNYDFYRIIASIESYYFVAVKLTILLAIGHSFFFQFQTILASNSILYRGHVHVLFLAPDDNNKNLKSRKG